MLFFESSQKKECDKRFLGIDHGDGDNRGHGRFLRWRRAGCWLTQAGVLEITRPAWFLDLGQSCAWRDLMSCLTPRPPYPVRTVRPVPLPPPSCATANSIKNSFREGAYRRFCFRWIEVPRVIRS